MRNCSRIARNYAQLRAIFRNLQGSQFRASKSQLRWKPYVEDTVEKSLLIWVSPWLKKKQEIRLFFVHGEATNENEQFKETNNIDQ